METQTIIKVVEPITNKPIFGYKCDIIISKNGKIMKQYSTKTSNYGLINVRSGFGLTITVAILKGGIYSQLEKIVSNSSEKPKYFTIKASKIVIKGKQESLTVFLAGAGMRGTYIDKTTKALEKAGIKNVRKGNYSALFGGFDEELLKDIDMGGDAVSVVFYNQILSSPKNSPLFAVPQFNGDIEAYNRAIQNSAKNIKKNLPLKIQLSDIQIYDPIPKNGQFNFIGYSWGSVIASRSALYYANQNIKIHHLVLIGAPIEKNLLQAVQNHKNIGKVIVIDLTKQGDPIYAGMSDTEIAKALSGLLPQMLQGGEGHFYYASEKPIGEVRRAELAQRLYKDGLR